MCMGDGNMYSGGGHIKTCDSFVDSILFSAQSLPKNVQRSNTQSLEEWLGQALSSQIIERDDWSHDLRGRSGMMAAHNVSHHSLPPNVRSRHYFEPTSGQKDCDRVNDNSLSPMCKDGYRGRRRGSIDQALFPLSDLDGQISNDFSSFLTQESSNVSGWESSDRGTPDIKGHRRASAYDAAFQQVLSQAPTPTREYHSTLRHSVTSPLGVSSNIDIGGLTLLHVSSREHVQSWGGKPSHIGAQADSCRMSFV